MSHYAEAHLRLIFALLLSIWPVAESIIWFRLRLMIKAYCIKYSVTLSFLTYKLR